jgi:hypothetical protein
VRIIFGVVHSICNTVCMGSFQPPVKQLQPWLPLQIHKLQLLPPQLLRLPLRKTTFIMMFTKVQSILRSNGEELLQCIFFSLYQKLWRSYILFKICRKITISKFCGLRSSIVHSLLFKFSTIVNALLTYRVDGISQRMCV